MNKAVFNFYEAIATHSSCKFKLKNAIASKVCNCDIAKVVSPHKCELGVWLDSLKSNLYKYPIFKEVYDLHVLLHIETAHIMKLILDGKTDEASEAIASGGKFASISFSFTRAMMKLESS